MKTPLHPGWDWYLGYLKRRGWKIAALLAATGVLSLSALPALALVRHVFDAAIPAGDFAAILLAGAGILGVRTAAALAGIVVTRQTAKVLRGITGEMRGDLMARLHRLRWLDLGQMDDIRAQGRIVHETERVEYLTQGLLQAALPSLGPIAVYGAVMLWLSWQVTLVVALIALVSRLVTWFTARRLRRVIARFQAVFETFHLATQRTIHMLRATRMQATEARAVAHYRGVTADLARSGTEMAAASAVNNQTSAIVSSVLAVAAMVVGAMAVSGGAMTMGAFAAFFVAASQANAAVRGLMGSLPQVLGGHEALVRLTALRGIGEEEAMGGTRPPAMHEPIILEEVSFAYPDRRVLDGVSLTVEPGMITALAAPNGEGKTTVLDLVLGLHRPDAGQVRQGGTGFSDIDLVAYRLKTGVAPQNPLFFRGTVRENIAFGRGEVSEADLARAIHLAALDPVLANLPLGLDAPMGDNGQLLSGGERQRVALARALVHRPALLVLDEPTNHLDAASVALLIERLFTGPERPTILMATHDPRLLALAHRIYELEGGAARERPARRLAAVPA